MMECFNFDRQWRKWIMECVSTVSTSILVDGSPSGEFKLEQGLRQGNPLSPFLFLIVAKGLGIMMKKARKLDMFKGACIGTNNIIVYYLQFADDTIFVGEATRENAWTIKMILRNMELVSGLKVNFEKCCTYGVNVSFD